MAKDKGEEAAATMLFAESRKLSQLYRRLETCGKPWVAAHQRHRARRRLRAVRSPAISAIAADNGKIRVGLPEVKIGLFPGAGGTQRVARMMPAADALQMLLKGEQLSTSPAPRR